MSCDYLRSAPIRRLPHSMEDNPIWSVLGSAISSVVAVALSLPLLLAFLLVLPACLSVRWLLLFLYCSREGSRLSPGPESVRGNESRWLGTEWRSSVIHVVLVFEAKEGVNVDHFRRLLLKRIIPLYPRLTQRLIPLPVSAGRGNCWLADSKFSIDHHIFSGPSFLTNEKDLQEYVSKLVEDGLPEDKPPWQLQVFQTFGVNQDTVVILRVHQSIADGTVLMRLLCQSLADSQVIEIPERPRPGSLAFCFNVFRACVIGPLTLFLWLFLTGEDYNILTHRSSWTGSVTVTWSASITLPKVTRIKQVTRSTVNCVLLSALAGAIRRLLQGYGVKQPPDVKIVVPMDLRNQSSTAPPRTNLGNKTSSVTMPLPVAVEGCIPRLWATRKTLGSLRTSPDPVILYMATAALMSIGSASFARYLVNILKDKASLQFASLPGPASEILLEGQTLKGIYPILPAQANLGISITTITYADQVFVSVIAERALGPAAELILEYLEDQIEVLWKLLLNRRVPGEPESPTIFTKTNVSDSPVREITSRLNLVQKEVERLSEGKDTDKDGKLSTLRAEYSELVAELKRRQSLSELEEPDPSWKPRRRAFSHSTSKKQCSNSPKTIREEFSSFDLPEMSEVDERSTNNHQKHQNVHSTRLEHFNKITELKPNVEGKQKGTSNTCNRQSVKCDRTKPPKGCASASENGNFNPSSYSPIRSNNMRQNNEYETFVIPEDDSEFDGENKSELKLDKSEIRTSTSDRDAQKVNKVQQKTLKYDEVKSCSIPTPRRSAEEVQRSQNPEESSKRSDISDAVIKIPDEDPPGPLGPLDTKCDLTYSNYLEVFNLEKKQLIQVPCQFYGVRMQEKFVDSDESEVVGGVLI